MNGAAGRGHSVVLAKAGIEAFLVVGVSSDNFGD